MSVHILAEFAVRRTIQIVAGVALLVLALTGCALNLNTGEQEVTVEGCVKDAKLALDGTQLLVCPRIENEVDRQTCLDSAQLGYDATVLACNRWATPTEDLALPEDEAPETP
jgi:precorrin-2 methylase